RPRHHGSRARRQRARPARTRRQARRVRPRRYPPRPGPVRLEPARPRGPGRAGGARGSRMTRVLTVLPAMPLPATAGLQLRMMEELQIVRALGCQTPGLAFQTEDDNPGADRLSPLCAGAIAGGPRV